MITELNSEFKIDDIEQMMEGLEVRDEYICVFDACFGKISLCICLGVACAGYVGIGIGVCAAGV